MSSSMKTEHGNAEALEYLRMHLRLDMPTSMPREFALMHQSAFARMTVSKSSELLMLCQLYRLKASCFAGVRSVYEENNNIVSSIFIDIDDAKLEKSKEKANLVIRSLFEHYSALPRVHFSGKKGFHLWYDFEPVEVRSYKDAVISLLSNAKVLQCVDVNSLGKSHGIARLPFSVHLDTGMLCTPICISDIKTYVPGVSISSADYVSFIKENRGLASALKRSSTHIAETSGKCISINVGDKHPPCMAELARRIAEDEDISHDERVLLTSYMIQRGFDRKGLESLFMPRSDYNESTTNYYIEHLTKRALTYTKCRKIIAMGSCPLPATLRKLCDFWPYMGIKLPTK